MGMAYRCDKCGQYYDWYESFFANKELNHMTPKELAAWDQKNPDAPFQETSKAQFRANALKFMFMEPVNDNCATNDGVLNSEIEECTEGNNILITLCPDCMTDLTKTLGNWWSLGGWWNNI